jgi:ADP-ribose pyrophosphatase
MKPGTGLAQDLGGGESKALFSTPWFKVLATPARNSSEPYYYIEAPDCAAVVALTPQKQLLLVRQFRPAVSAMTWEIPAGHVEPGETPEQAARKELLEETGYQAENFELLAMLSPSAARYANRMWCFFAENAAPAPSGQSQREPGIELILYDRSLRELLAEPEFNSGPSCAAFFAAIMRGKLKL